MMNGPDDYTSVNAAEWDRLSREGNVWTLPISHDEFVRAKGGEWRVILTPTKPVPRDWFPPLSGARVLGLASGGGQQCPIFVAAGARVTVFDLSAKQLETELIMAEREGYSIEIVKGDMTKTLPFPDGAFDLVFHPVSNCFVRDVEHVWREAHRVLRPGGSLLAGFTNPCVYLFEPDDPFRVVNRLPYDPLRRAGGTPAIRAEGGAIEFSHSLSTQIAGQIRAGFTLLDLYEDSDGVSPLGEYFPGYIATRSVKAR